MLTRGRTLLVGLLVCAATRPAGAGEAARAFAELSAGVDLFDKPSVARALARLRKVDPDFWEDDLPAGPLRGRLAQQMTRDEVSALLRRAARDPVRRAGRRATLARNLVAREDLAALLIEADALPDLAGADPDALAAIGSAALVRGDRRPALFMLSSPATTLAMAEDLCQLSSPHGLRLLADVVADARSIPSDARAALARYVPDTQNARGVTPLGEERTRALVRAAGHDPDHAVRALAARLLDRAGADFVATLEAHGRARSGELEREEWERLGRWFQRGTTDRGLPATSRIALLRGVIGDADADADPIDAERVMAEVRRVLAAESSPRMRGAMLSLLRWSDHLYLDGSTGSIRLLPSMEGLLDDLRLDPESDPPPLRALQADFVAAVRRQRGIEPGRRGTRNVGPGSGIYTELPGEGATPERFRAMLGKLEGWLATDPDHLVDPRFVEAILRWPQARRVELLARYPRATVQRLLLTPPSRHRVPGKSGFADDTSGATNRERLLRLFPDWSEHWDLLLDPRNLAGWPASSRRAAGRVLHTVAADRGYDTVRALLVDDAVASGFLEEVLVHPRGADPAVAARELARIDARPLLRSALSEWARTEMEEAPGPRDGAPWPREVAPLDDEARATLVNLLDHHADPWIAWIAARLLALSGEAADYAALFSSGEDLALVSVRGNHPLSDLVARIDSAGKLEIVLAFLGDARASADARADVFSELSYHRWPRNFAPATRVVMLDRIALWIERRAPNLDSGLAERFLPAWSEFAGRCAIEFAVPADYREGMRRIEERAIAAVPDFGTRWRLQHPATEGG